MEQMNHHDAEHDTFSDIDGLPHLAPVHAPDTLLPAVLARLERAGAHFSGEPSIEAYMAALNDPAWQVRTGAIQGLAALGARVPIETMVATLDDEDASVRAAAIRALGSLGERAPLESLVAALQDPEWLVREVAALTLGALGKRAPVEALVAAVHDENVFVCRAAALALVQAHFATVSTPAAQTQTVKSLQKQNRHIRSHVSTALHTALTLLATKGQGLLAFRQRKPDEERRPNNFSRLHRDASRVQQPAASRHRPSLRLLQGLFAALLVIVGMLFAWLPRVQHLTPLSPASHHTPAVLFTYQGGQGIEGSPVWPSESKYLALLSSFGYSVEVLNVATGNTVQNPLEPIPYLGPHTASAWSWSPNGRYLAVTSEDASKQDAAVQVWDTITGRNTLAMRSHANGILHIAWSLDGKRIACSGDDGVVQVWNPLTGQKVLTLAGHAGRWHRMLWSTDNQLLLLSSLDGTVQLWNAVTGTRISAFRGEASTSLALSPNGHLLVTSDELGTLSVWDTLSGRKLVTYVSQGLSEGVSFLQWSPESRRVLAASDSEVQIWDAVTGQTLLTFPNPGVGNLLLSSPAGMQTFTPNYSEVQIWDAIAGQILLAFPNPASSRAWQISPDGRYVSFGSWNNGVQVWDVNNGREVTSYSDHSGHVQVLAWSPDSQRLAFARSDGTVFVQDVKNGGDVATYQLFTPIVSLTWSPDSKLIAATSADNTVHVLQTM